MQKKFITNLAFLLLLNLLIKPFWILGIDRGVQNAVGAEDYGLYYAYFNFSFLLNILLDLGINSFNNRNIAQNQFLLNKHLSGILVIRMLLAVVYFLVSLFVAWLIGYDIFHAPLLLLLLFNQVLISFILYVRTNYSGLHQFKQDSLISVLDRFLMILIVGYLLWIRKSDTPMRIEWFIYAQTVSYILTGAIAFYFLARKAKLKKLTWNPVFFRMVLRKSYPFALLVLLMAIYFRIDAVMIERLLEDGKEKAGIYAQAFRLLDAASMIAYLFSALLFPIFSRMIKLREDVNELIRLSYSLLVIPAFILGVICFSYRTEIMQLLYHEHAELSSMPFGLMMFTFGAVSTSYIYGTLLTANNNTRYLNIIASISVVLNITLNLALIPRYDVIGAAVAGLVTQSISAILQVIVAYRLFRLKVDLKYLLSIFISLGFSFTLTWLSHFLPSGWIAQFLLCSLICMVLAFVLKLINLKSLFMIIRYQ